jgi:hypothetical protein
LFEGLLEVEDVQVVKEIAVEASEQDHGSANEDR